MLTLDEKMIIGLLGKTWNAFVKLPEQHGCDKQEFMQAIHEAQRIVMARVAYRELHPEKKNASKSPSA